jgi:hypothetical protein
MRLDEDKIVGCEFIVANGNTTTLLGLIEEPLDQVMCAVAINGEPGCPVLMAHRCVRGPNHFGR